MCGENINYVLKNVNIFSSAELIMIYYLFGAVDKCCNELFNYL